MIIMMMQRIYELMEELEEWEKEDRRSPDCDGAYWMMKRGRREYLEKCFTNDKKKENK